MRTHNEQYAETHNGKHVKTRNVIGILQKKNKMPNFPGMINIGTKYFFYSSNGILR